MRENGGRTPTSEERRPIQTILVRYNRLRNLLETVEISAKQASPQQVIYLRNELKPLFLLFKKIGSGGMFLHVRLCR